MKVPKELTTDDYKKVAEAISKAGDVGKQLQASGLTRKATVVLLAHATKLPQRHVEDVLDALVDLKRWCLKQ